MADKKEEKLNITNDLLDAMLVGVKTQEDLWGKEGIITKLSKALIERMLNAEMEFHLENNDDGRAAGNSRNGHGKKNVQGKFGHIELVTPRDRLSTFEPQIVPKRSTKLAMLEEAILSLYAKGMTVRDIQATLQDLYHVDVSHSLISKVTDVVNEEVEQWHARPLEAVYPVVWLDGIVVKVHQDHQVVNKTIYLALAINLNGYKELLGIWIAEHEGSKFWAQVLTEMNNRGVKDVFVFCIDGLTGFPDAIKGIYPKSDIQLCIVHMIRNSLKYVSYKNRKEVVRDLKQIYHAGTLESAEAALLRFAEKWNEKYPAIYALWERNWANIVTIFGYPAEIRRVIYTTNAIESLNGVIRSRIKTKRILGSDESALKIVWIAVGNASKKWTMPISNWHTALNHFYVKYSDRFPRVA